MDTHERSVKIIEIGFQVGTGRANLEIELKVMEILKADSMAEIPRKLKAANDKTVMRIHKIVCNRRAS